MSIAETCSINTCDSSVRARGYCNKHYQSFMKYGDALHRDRAKKRRLSQTCRVDNCAFKSNKGLVRGYCDTHYTRWLRWGDPNCVKVPRVSPYKVCQLDNCTRPHVSRGLCGTHYRHMRESTFSDCEIKNCDRKSASASFNICKAHKDRIKANGGKYAPSRRDRRPAVIEGDIAKIPLGVNAKDGYAIVDREYAWLDKYNWHIVNTPFSLTSYAGTKIVDTGEKILMHRLILKGDTSMPVDHIDGNGLNNRLNNIRIATYSHNMQNIGIRKSNTSGYTGVYANPLKSGMFWGVRIHSNGKSISGGMRHKTKEEAAMAYNKLALELYGEHARLNDV